jgi:hypothetical protein
MTDSNPKQPLTTADPASQPDTTSEAQHADGLAVTESYEAPKVRRLGTLLELTQSGSGRRTEAFLGSR